MASIIPKSFYTAAFGRNRADAVAGTRAEPGPKPATGAGQDASVLLLGASDADRQAGAYSVFGSSKALADAQKSARDLLAKLDQVRTSAVSERKAAAQQKLELARKKLQMLRMMGGDPKTIARQARQIAQEIREAAKEYGAAVQAGSGATLAAATAEAPATPAEATAAKGSEAAAGAAADATTGAEGQAQARAAETAQAGQGGADKGSADKGSADKGPVDKATVREQAAKAYQDMAAKLDQKGAASTAEREALDKFKQAADEAKRLIEDAVRKLRARNANDPDAREAEKAKNAMLNQIDELGDTMRAAETGIDAASPATGGAGAEVATAVPAINILA